MTGPLDGIRVVDFTIAQQGPHATKLLADMGAEVIKIERRQGRTGGGEPWMRGFVLAHNRNKRAISLDLKHPEGNEIARRLAATADVVASNFRQGVMEKLGLGFEDLRRANPRVVVVQGSGWGPLGPRVTEGAVDMVGHARGGLMWRTGFEGRGPMTVGCAVTDQVGALVLGAALLGALARAARTGHGEKVDTSLYGGQVALQAWEFAERSLRGGGAQPRAGTGHPLIKGRGVWQAFEASDGWLAIGCTDPSRLGALCEVAGVEPAAAGSPAEAIAAVVAGLAGRLRGRPAAEWVELLRAAGIAAAPVQRYGDIRRDEQARANGYLLEMDHPEYGEITVAGMPITFDLEPMARATPPPSFGEHTERYLEELGYGWDEITRLRDESVC
ncbi:MAG: CoA transferase [Chloroflexi bacterium]|nr:CoA transferase [Chloroflexota bacterium]